MKPEQSNYGYVSKSVRVFNPHMNFRKTYISRYTSKGRLRRDAIKKLVYRA